jgi:hypothetical protein
VNRAVLVVVACLALLAALALLEEWLWPTD